MIWGENPLFLGNTHIIPGDSSRDLLYAPIWRSLNLTFEAVMFLLFFHHPKKGHQEELPGICALYSISILGRWDDEWDVNHYHCLLDCLLVCLLVCLLDCFGLFWDVFIGCPLKIIEIGKRCLPKNGRWQQVNNMNHWFPLIGPY